MFWKRLISGIILLLGIVGIFSLGGMLLCISLLIISLIGLFEIYRVFSMESSMLAFICYGVCVLYYADLYMGFLPDGWMMVVLFLLLLLAVYVIKFPEYDSSEIMKAFFGFFYVALLLSFLYRIRHGENGLLHVWLVFISSWGSDTMAYCTGRLFGKHALKESLSPKKTMEGSAGGIIGAFLLGVIYGGIICGIYGYDMHIAPVYGVMSALGSVVSQIGDLAASAIKRNYDIKDYGHLIPGHGGILDRFDSVIMTAPLIYYVSLYFMR